MKGKRAVYGLRVPEAGPLSARDRLAVPPLSAGHDVRLVAIGTAGLGAATESTGDNAGERSSGCDASLPQVWSVIH